MEPKEIRIDLGGSVEAVAELDTMGFWSCCIWIEGEEVDESMPVQSAILLFPNFDVDNYIMP